LSFLLLPVLEVVGPLYLHSKPPLDPRNCISFSQFTGSAGSTGGVEIGLDRQRTVIALSRNIDILVLDVKWRDDQVCFQAIA